VVLELHGAEAEGAPSVAQKEYRSIETRLLWGKLISMQEGGEGGEKDEKNMNKR